MTVKEKLDKILQLVLPSLMVFMVVVSFTLSIVSLSRSIKTSNEVSELSAEFVELAADIRKSNDDISLTLNALEGHIAFFDKYLGDHANFFYGNDRVTVKNNNRK